MIQFHIYFITETRLNDNFYSSELGLTNNIYRCDRNLLSSSYSCDECVHIYVRKDNPSFVVITLVHNVKQLFICIEFEVKKCIYNAVYLSPLSLTSMYDSYVTLIDLVIYEHPNHLFTCCSDFIIQKLLGQITIL